MVSDLPIEGGIVMDIDDKEFQNKVLTDIQSEIIRYYNEKNIQYKNPKKPENTILDFFSYLYRLIPTVKRNVHYSEELMLKIKRKEISLEHVEILKKFKSAFKEGKDMNIFLSNNTKNAQATDFLQYTWSLFHLHMSNKFVDDKSQMKNNRSDTQLLCIIDDRDVYFVDVIPHPKTSEDYFDINFLRIIKNNGWMDKIGFFEIEGMILGSMEHKITNPGDIFRLYSEGSINICFEFDGKGFCCFKPMNSIRRPSDATQRLINLNKNIKDLCGYKDAYRGFCLESDNQGRLFGLVKLENNGIKYRKIF